MEKTNQTKKNQHIIINGHGSNQIKDPIKRQSIRRIKMKRDNQ